MHLPSAELPPPRVVGAVECCGTVHDQQSISDGGNKWDRRISRKGMGGGGGGGGGVYECSYLDSAIIAEAWSSS